LFLHYWFITAADEAKFLDQSCIERHHFLFGWVKGNLFLLWVLNAIVQTGFHI
jgi:hypothetical protein